MTNDLTTTGLTLTLAAADKATDSGNAAWMLISASLVLLMTPALAFFYGGMSSQKSVLNMMMMSFGAMGVVTVTYILWGWSMSYGPTDLGGLFANPFDQFGLKGMLPAADGTQAPGDFGYPPIIDVGFQLTFAIITVALVSGSIANRVKYGTWLIFAGLWASFAYYPLAHMVWGGGLLSHSEHGLSAMMFGTTESNGEIVASVAPIDFAGGTVVHINAGMAALILALVVGRSASFMKVPHRPHNLTLVMIGAALLWFGWFGFNAGSAFGANASAGLAWVNTTAATAAAMLGWLLTEKIRDGHATTLGAASGIVAGLVAITPACGNLTPVTSLILGATAGMFSALAVGLKYKFKYDDSLDVIAVHLVSGLWGTVAIGLLATDSGELTGGGADGFKLLIVQIVIAFAALLFTAIVTTIIALALKATIGWRIDHSDEREGIDQTVHSETAYDYFGTDIR